MRHVIASVKFGYALLLLCVNTAYGASHAFSVPISLCVAKNNVHHATMLLHIESKCRQVSKKQEKLPL